MNRGNKLISWPLMREGLKQFWYVPVLMFIAYFMFGLFPLIMFDTDYTGRFAISSLNNQNIGFLMIIGGFSLLAGCVATRMWHGQAQAFSVISQPYSRSKVFSTNVLTGWLMLMAPMLLMGIIYLAISHFVMYMPQDAVTSNSGVWLDQAMVQAYGVTDVLRWILESTGLFTFMYALCILAGVFSGTTLMAVLLSLFNMSIIPSLLGTGIFYADSYLKGYYTPGEMTVRLICGSNPVLGKMFIEMDSYVPMFGTVVRSILYLLIGAVLIILAGAAFRRAKLERSGDHMMSRRGEALVTAVLTFEGAAFLGLIMGLGFESKGAMVIGNILGAVLTWFIVKVILVRTVKVFKKEHVIPLIAGAVCAAIFVGAFVGDIFGFASRVPDRADVTGITADSLINDNRITLYDSHDEIIDDDQDRIISDDEFVSKVVDYQNYIVDHGLVTDSGDGDYTVKLRYALKNGKMFERLYHVSTDTQSLAMLQELADSKAYKDGFKLSKDFLSKVRRAEINYSTYSSRDGEPGYDIYVQVRDRETMERIIDAYNATIDSTRFDVPSWVTEDEYMEPENVCWTYIEFIYDSESAEDGYLDVNLNLDMLDSELSDLIIDLYENEN